MSTWDNCKTRRLLTGGLTCHGIE